MGACKALELCFSIVGIPLLTVQLRDGAVNGFADQGLGADGPVARVRESILVGPFIQHTVHSSSRDKLFKSEIEAFNRK